MDAWEICSYASIPSWPLFTIISLVCPEISIAVIQAPVTFCYSIYPFHRLPTDGTAVLAPASRPKGVPGPCPFEGATPLEKVRHVCNWPSSVMPAQTPTPSDMCFNLSPWAIHGPWPGEGIDGTSGIPPAGFETPQVHWWTSPSLVRATKSSP